MTQTATRLFDFAYLQLKNNQQEKLFNTKVNNSWVATSTLEYLELANNISRALLRLGVKPGDKIAVVTSTNRIEWSILDIAVLQIGAVNVPLYPTISSKDYAYIINHSDAIYCFVSDSYLAKKVSKIKDKTQLKDIYAFDTVKGVASWKSLLELGEDASNQKDVNILKKKVNKTDLATIIYTSGTTGIPKGVMLSHQNIVENTYVSSKALDLEAKTYKVLSYLPVCHIFERFALYYYQLMGFEIYFAESIDKLGDNLREVKPHFIPVVPRLLEKIYDKIVDKGSNLTGIKKALFFWALNLAKNYQPYNKNSWWYHFQLKIANKIIFNKWREALGGNIKFLVSGSAPLQPQLIQIFTAANIPVFEGYGMTETSPGISINDLRNKGFKIGTVGKALENIEIKIADDGEILVKGSNVMLGYYKNEALTTKTIINNYLHTGDIGELDNEGFLKITDRKKEMFKTSGGKYIAPAVLENKLKESRFIEQIMVIGEGQKMAAAIIQPHFEFLNEWVKRKKIKTDNSLDAIVSNKKIIKRIQKEIDQANKKFGQWEQIKVFKLTPEVWSIENGLLTPTMKIKRNAIKNKYQKLIDQIYKTTK
ncbi:long-chain fatty acid--CoA ligase [Lutibacter sp. A80]|uniref:AMP-dependent synthetase/ligase n=1 Tax=Lutibacter sp. A80 TaxID=2918453 RepID=UPI001F061176|nr:long-chain fatty acid--CoA ligase [Lutibacter sp. A80]UMB61041.1 long-chain fatty acid--CoA ligase [Lutibacter sp. A80]